MNQNSPLASATVGQIAINAKDLPRATAFYRDVLKFPFLMEAGKMAFFQCGEVRLMLSEPEGPEYDHPSSIVYFRVQRIRDCFEALRASGVSFVGEPHCVAPMADHDLWMAFFRDSEDNVLAMMSEEPKSSES